MTRPVFVICAPSMGFPEGMAATARVRQYANAFRDAGYDTTVICPAPSESETTPKRNTRTHGSIDGISFWYSSGSTVRAGNFIARRRGAFESWLRIIACVLRSRPAAVLAYPMTPTVALLVMPFARLVKTRVLCDQSELPEIHAGGGALGPIRLWVKMWGMRHSNGIIAITPVILEHVRPLVSPVPVILVPVMIDQNDYRRKIDTPESGAVVYTGPLNDSKDGVGTLLEAFARVATTHPRVRLILVGDATPERVAAYQSRAQNLSIGGSVDFRGTVARPELLDILRQASVLVLPRPDTAQNRANMPTKLVEYMASGRPVVATSVGLVPQMVNNGAQALLVAPDDSADLAAGIAAALEDPTAAAEMGTRALQLAITTYDYRVYTSLLDEFAQGCPLSDR